MRKEKIFPYVFLCFLLFSALSFPDRISGKWRRIAVSSLAPSWHFCEKVKIQGMFFAASSAFPRSETEKYMKEMEDLKRTNRALSDQMENIRQWILSEDRIEEQLGRIRFLDPLEKIEEWREYCQRRRGQMASLLKRQLKAVPAQVIYRDPASWSSFVWLDVGEKVNRTLQEAVIAKNSPVVIGSTLVGVVEEVGEKQCKVRLITDANLCPAVRAARGEGQDLLLLEQLEGTLQLLQTRRDLFSSQEEERIAFGVIQATLERLKSSQTTSYLAKGELQGSSLPLWRARGQKLKGVGFNYDFADEEGPARDLRTGEILSEKDGRKKSLPLLKEGDLLITSGLDGVFPAGLEVAVISKVHRLREGASSYEIEAIALAENFSELSSVFILPPISSF